MDTAAVEMPVYNESNITCYQPLLWNHDVISSIKPQLYVCILASCVHTIFWFQLVFCSSLRQKSMQWLYAYLMTDALLLFRFFFSYIVHTKSNTCQPSQSWILFNCYFEAIPDNYLNILSVYILIALNICRYTQIVFNRNVYEVYVKPVIFVHLCIYIIPLSILIIQFVANWALVQQYPKDSCQIVYTNAYIQICNIAFGCVLPIFSNILVIYASFRYIRANSTLQAGLHHALARDKYNRALVIQFLCFYIIWVPLWAPNVIVYQTTILYKNLVNTVSLLNYYGIALDPIIIAALDARFFHAWRKGWLRLKNKLLFYRTQGRRIQPATIYPIPNLAKTSQNEANAS